MIHLLIMFRVLHVVIVFVNLIVNSTSVDVHTRKRSFSHSPWTMIPYQMIKRTNPLFLMSIMTLPLKCAQWHLYVVRQENKLWRDTFYNRSEYPSSWFILYNSFLSLKSCDPQTLKTNCVLMVVICDVLNTGLIRDYVAQGKLKRQQWKECRKKPTAKI